MLKGRSALITGSTSGIGYGIARALAAQGCAVMLNGFGPQDDIERKRAELERDFGVTACYCFADLSNPDEAEQLVDQTAVDLGKLDILVNNAGVQHTAPLEEFPRENWHNILSINLSAAFFTLQRALPGMRQRGFGRVINTASVHGLVASINKAAYVAAKHGLVGLTKVAALETAGSGVTVNAVCPGWTRTELVEPQIAARAAAKGLDLAAAAHDLVSEKQPSGEFVTIEQIGQLIVFLCSPAAAQITGVTLPIDGGWTAQ